MAQSGFHTVVLVAMGVVGLIWLAAAIRHDEQWTQARRIFVGSCMFVVFFVEALTAFPSVASASSAELFGFFGCALGSLGAIFQAIGLRDFRRRPVAVSDA